MVAGVELLLLDPDECYTRTASAYTAKPTIFAAGRFTLHSSCGASASMHATHLLLFRLARSPLQRRVLE
jgi:hypothetical protein